jgi:hypothetical protein
MGRVSQVSVRSSRGVLSRYPDTLKLAPSLREGGDTIPEGTLIFTKIRVA